MTVQQFVFDVFAFIAIAGALVVVLSNNPVRCVLALVLAFFASAVIWILAHAEFLALVLILVYVGAVMTLFLFVIMMLDIDIVTQKRRYVRYFPLAFAVGGLLVFLMMYAILPDTFTLEHLSAAKLQSADYSNVKELGRVLYTQYVYGFELAAVLLLVAIIAAISLSHRPPRNCKVQEPRKQIQVNSKDRIKLIKMAPSSKPGAPADESGVVT